MANLSRERDRGQILLIAAFTLAVTFVALALVVNSAIFTENLASRGEVAGSSEALTYKHQVEQSVASAIEHANVHDYGSPSSSVLTSIDAIAERGGRQQATGGQLVHINENGLEPGYRIADESPGGSQFLNDSTPAAVANWQLADGVDRTRNVEITVTDASALAGGPGTAFRLQAREPAATWELRLWDDGTSVRVEVVTAAGTNRECRVPRTTPIEIDVTDGLVNGERCHALTRSETSGDRMWWGTGLSGGSYEIWIENGDQIEGNYSLVTDGSPTTTNLEAGPTNGDPYWTDAVYSATLEYVFESTQVTYVTEIEVAPGEPR